MMSEQWPITKLGDIISLEYGKPLPKEDRDPEGAFPVYGANGEKARSNKFYHSTPTIIVGRKGSAGELNLTEGKFWPLDVTYFVTFDEEKYEMKFLYYLLQTLNLPSMAKGVKPGINRNDVYALEVRIPPKEEQQRIVSILDESFESLSHELLKTTHQYSSNKEIYASYFSTIDCSVKVALGEVVDIVSGKINSNQAVEGGKYPFFTCGKQPLEIDHYAFDCEAILLAGNNASGDFNVKHYKGKFHVRQRTYVITIPNPERLNYRFLYHQLRGALGHMKDIAVGTTTRFVRLGMVKGLEIHLPNLADQLSIVEEIENIEESTQNLESIYLQRITAINELQQSILQEAFSGQLTGGLVA
jgi:type I restriction enzyme, S subunit